MDEETKDGIEKIRSMLKGAAAKPATPITNIMQQPVANLKEKDMDKSNFESMIHDWLADQGEEMEDLEIGSAYWSDELKDWVADAEDAKADYILFADATGNIRIAYAGTK